jgi:hypothetical protein
MAERPEEEVRRAAELAARGRKIDLWQEILESSRLVSQYGKTAALALAGRGITFSDASEILSKEPKLSNKFLELVVRKEREALFRRFRWG